MESRKYNVQYVQSYEFHWLLSDIEVIISKYIYKPFTIYSCLQSPATKTEENLHQWNQFPLTFPGLYPWDYVASLSSIFHSFFKLIWWRNYHSKKRQRERQRERELIITSYYVCCLAIIPSHRNSGEIKRSVYIISIAVLIPQWAIHYLFIYCHVKLFKSVFVFALEAVFTVIYLFFSSQFT